MKQWRLFQLENKRKTKKQRVRNPLGKICWEERVISVLLDHWYVKGNSECKVNTGYQQIRVDFESEIKELTGFELYYIKTILETMYRMN